MGKFTFPVIAGKYLAVATIVVSALVLITGVAFATLTVADWGAGHQFVSQSVFVWDNFRNAFHLPYRIEERKPEVFISAVVEKVENKDFTPTEQKIIDKWGVRDGIMALAIFDCGESGLDQYAVSYTGDLGIAQINWSTWKRLAKERFGYNAADMFDVDRNLDMAYVAWDRGNGVEGDKKGTWDAWVGFQNGSYLRCLK